MSRERPTGVKAGIEKGRMLKSSLLNQDQAKSEAASEEKEDAYACSGSKGTSGLRCH